MKHALRLTTLAVGLALSLPAFATQEYNNILINRVYVDPTDIVVLTNTANGCGSNFYHLPRSNANFKEVFAFIFLSFKNQVPINFAVQDACNGDRRYVSHASMGSG